MKKKSHLKLNMKMKSSDIALMQISLFLIQLSSK